MMKKRKCKMMWIGVLTGIFIIIAGIGVFLALPFSPVKEAFERVVAEKAQGTTEGLFAEEDLAGLPTPVQRYFRYCGYLGTPKMAYMKASLRQVDFIMEENKTIKIDYTQFNLVERPERFALIASSLKGIPFEGLDSYEHGKGSMKGVIGKVITLFDQQGEMMDRACLVTWLSECLLVPNAALQECVRWEPVDDTHAKAVVTWQGQSAEGMFTFAETGELLSFRTSDRTAVDMDGKETQADWSGFFRDYQQVNGILQPRVIQSVWHFQEGDRVYFNENEAPVSIRYK